MVASDVQNLLSKISLAEMIGRSDEIARLESHAAGQSAENLLVVSGAPRVGVSDILRQVYDRVFLANAEILPVYFAIANGDRSASEIARRFAYELLLQFVAFRRREPQLVGQRPNIDELVRIAGVSDAAFVDQVAELITNADDHPSSEMVRSLFSLPLRIAGMGVRCFVIFDDVHRAIDLEDGNAVMRAIRDVCSTAEFPCVVAGRRRAVYGNFPDHRMTIDKLSFEDAGMLIESLAAKNGVSLNDQTRDLIAVQLDRDPQFITYVIERAGATNRPLDSFRNFQSVYADEISGGKISRCLGAEFFNATGSTESARTFASLAAKVVSSPQQTAASKKVFERSGMDTFNFQRAISHLDSAEICSTHGERFSVESENRPLTDYLEFHRTLDIPSVSRAQAVGESAAQYVRRAPHLMARHYRRLSAIGVAEMMRIFDGRKVPTALLDYGKYREELKGREASDIASRLADETDVTTLPRIVYTAHSSAYYRPIGEFVDTERSAVALGFEQDGNDDIAWLATELDSKLEASASLTEFWCDRLEMLAAHCDLPTFKIWLISPEGFSTEALAVLSERGAVGSSKAQIDLLKSHLEIEQSDRSLSAEQYQMTIPMGDDTEMLAVHMIEEIARRNEYPNSAINKIKTAVVEACINAAEHSLSLDRKIYIGVTASRERIRIAIENRGVGVAIKLAAATEESTGRRGWGLTLIKNLMDELTFDQTDDGTRLVMSKIIERTEQQK